MNELVAATRWQVEQVFALAPKPSSLTAAQPLAVPGRWVGAGCDERAVWGRCTGGSAEPYECAVDHVAVAVRCSWPSRVVPCKHALALLLLWARGQVAEGEAPAFAAAVVASAVAKAAKQVGEVLEALAVPAPVPSSDDGGDAGPVAPPTQRPAMHSGLQSPMRVTSAITAHTSLAGRLMVIVADPELMIAA